MHNKAIGSKSQLLSRGDLLRLCGAALVAAVTVKTGPARAAGRPAKSPEAIVEGIYRKAIRPLTGESGPGGGSFLFERPAMRTRFSRGFNDLWVRAHAVAHEDEEGPVIDFDPVTDSQDPDFGRYRVDVESRTASREVVAARLWAPGETRPQVVKYDFVLEGGAWKIDDMRGQGAGEAWSLRWILQTALTDAEHRKPDVR